VSGLTRLMMEGQKDDGDKGTSRRENRRETWAPGLAANGAWPSACMGLTWTTVTNTAGRQRFHATL